MFIPITRTLQLEFVLSFYGVTKLTLITEKNKFYRTLFFVQNTFSDDFYIYYSMRKKDTQWERKNLLNLGKKVCSQSDTNFYI